MPNMQLFSLMFSRHVVSNRPVFDLESIIISNIIFLKKIVSVTQSVSRI